MCNSSRSKYYKIMSIVTLIVMCAMLVGQIMNVIDQFGAKVGFLPIVATFLNMLATLTIGSGLANLFYSHGLNIEEQCK